MLLKKKNLRDFKLSPFSDLQVLSKQKVKVMIELYIVRLQVEGFSNTKSPPVKTRTIFEGGVFHVFKEFCQITS